MKNNIQLFAKLIRKFTGRMQTYKITNKTKQKRAGTVLLVFLLLFLSVFTACGFNQAALETASDPDPQSGAIQLHFIDVGQGDSILVLLPDRKVMLVDAGNAENGKQIVNYVKAFQKDKIDYLIATHPHADHIGGMAEVVKSFEIGQIFMPKASANTRTFENLLTTIQDKDLKITTARAGTAVLRENGVSIEILSPNNEEYKDLNNYSVTVKISYQKNTFLLTGDIEKESEKEILDKGYDISADVLKVAHHGSNSSSSERFIRAADPKYAIISCGKDNSYNHPSPKTLTALQNYNVTIYRTDESGTIIVTGDGETITVKEERSR